MAYEPLRFSPKQLSVCNKVYHITALLHAYDISDDGTEGFYNPHLMAECFPSHFQIGSNSKYLIILLTSNRTPTPATTKIGATEFSDMTSSPVRQLSLDNW